MLSGALFSKSRSDVEEGTGVCLARVNNQSAESSFESDDIDSNSDSKHRRILDDGGSGEEEHFLENNGLVGVGDAVCWWKIYALHGLFLWNTRTYEFAAIILLATAYPKSLAAASIRGVATTVSSMLLSPLLGSWIDNCPTRIRALQSTIIVNHSSMILLYLCWMIWPFEEASSSAQHQSSSLPFSNLSEGLIFALILILDVLFASSKIGNDLCMERSWIPTLIRSSSSASESTISKEGNVTLTQVNSVMRRIDLLCKLIAPSLLPIIIVTINSRQIWILLLTISGTAIFALEIWFADRVSRENPILRQFSSSQKYDADPNSGNISHGDAIDKKEKTWQSPIGLLIQYFSTTIWPASISAAVIQLTVLTYTATLVTYLIDVGFSLQVISVTKASGTIAAIGSTFVTPILVDRRQQKQDLTTGEEANDLDTGEANRTTAIQEIGLLAIFGNFFILMPAVFSLWYLSPNVDSKSQQLTSPGATPLLTFLIVVLFTTLSLSRIFHWSYDLIVLEITQTSLPNSQQASFAGTEHSFRSGFELTHWLCTIVWSGTEEFKFLALGSLGSVAFAAAMYYWWFSAMRVFRGSKTGRYLRLEVVEGSHAG